MIQFFTDSYNSIKFNQSIQTDKITNFSKTLPSLLQLHSANFFFVIFSAKLINVLFPNRIKKLVHLMKIDFHIKPQPLAFSCLGMLREKFLTFIYDTIR